MRTLYTPKHILFQYIIFRIYWLENEIMFTDNVHIYTCDSCLLLVSDFIYILNTNGSNDHYLAFQMRIIFFWENMSKWCNIDSNIIFLLFMCSTTHYMCTKLLQLSSVLCRHKDSCVCDHYSRRLHINSHRIEMRHHYEDSEYISSLMNLRRMLPNYIEIIYYMKGAIHPDLLY